MTDSAPYHDGDRRTAARFAFAFAGLAILLVATSTPRTVGDGDEYVGMSMAIIGHGSPALTSEQIDALREQLALRDLRLLPDACHGTLIDYDTSGRLTNRWDLSVSYASVAFCETAGDA